MRFYRTIQSFFQRNSPLWLRQAIKFGLVGGLNTLVDLGTYTLLVHLTGLLGGQLVLAKAISYTAGIANSFIWNRRWTFRSQANPKQTLIPFFMVNAIALGINALVMHLFLNTAGWPELAAVLLATAATLAWNFLTSKFLVFRSHIPSSESSSEPADLLKGSGRL